MGRKNNKVRNANQKGRLNRRQKGEQRLPEPMKQTRDRVEDLVIPDGQCRHFTRRPKAMFLTKEKAQRALRQAQRSRERRGSGHVERRFYACPDGGCGGYHLTSREEYAQ